MKTNKYDLIEIYVPGALWMNHINGPHPAVRGLIIQANYKYLLLVNGRNTNTKGNYTGAIQSKRVSFSHGVKRDNFNFYLHQSITSTKGLAQTDAFQTRWKNEK